MGNSQAASSKMMCGSGECFSEQENHNSIGAPTIAVIHAALVRERHKKHHKFDDIYEVCSEIGQGGLCSILKIRKNESYVGGSSRREHVRRKVHYRRILNNLRGRNGSKDKKDDDDCSSCSSSNDSSRNHLYFALKVINLKLVKEDKIDQLKNEVEILKALDHKNIIKAYETFQDKVSKKIMIVMELCTGGDLFARLSYSEEQAAHVTREILSAISYMHNRKKIAHRDIKFENIIFESQHPQAVIKVIDFGLSKVYANSGGILNERVGTLYSMSPETMKGASTAQADLWSIGVCTYMLLANGRKPFEGNTPKEVVAKVLQGKYSFDGPEWIGVSDEAKQFVKDLLVVDPSKRMSAVEAINHPWFSIKEAGSSYGKSSVSSSVKQRVIEGIISYAEASDFRKLALNVIAKKSTSKEIFELRQVFHEFDTLNTGTITLEEFREVLSHFQFEENDLIEIFRKVDINNTNVINYTEFLAAALETQGTIEEYRLAEAFDLMDGDDSGYISRDDLRRIFDGNVDDAYIEKLVAEADPKKVGRISYDDFLQVFCREKQMRVSYLYDQCESENPSQKETEEVLRKNGLLKNLRIRGLGSKSNLRSLARVRSRSR